MNEISKFDFSKIEDQKKFDASPEDIKKNVIENSQEEAKAFQRLIKSGQAFNYHQAERRNLENICNKLERYLTYGSLLEAEKIISSNILPKEIIETPMIQIAACRGLKALLSYGDIEKSKKLIDLDLLPEYKFQEIIYEALKKTLVSLSSYTYNYIKEFKKIIDLNLLPKEKLETSEIREAAYESLKNLLSGGHFEYSKMLIDLNLLPKEKLETPEIRAIFKQEVARRIDWDDAESVKELLSFIGMQELIELFPELRIRSENVFKSLERIDRIDPVGVQKLKMNFNRSFSLQLFFYQNSEEQIMEMVIKNPFLLDALIGNEQFGSRLVSAYGGFDEISKSKIGSIFQFKEEILKENPQIKKDSPEFRLRMQEKLREFMDNPKILAEMKEREIDVAKWLDYDVKDNFVLGGGETGDISINQLIERPFNRIMGETIPEYISILEGELVPYQKDLQGAYISNPQAEEIDNKIATMRKALIETDDEKKKNGILKGIRSLEAKQEKLKPISLAEKIKGSIFGINSLMEIVRNKKAEIAINEEEKNFKKINELKKKIFEDYKTLCVRFENFQSELHSYLTEYFKEHGDAIIQSIDQQTAEMLSHFTTDNEDIRKVFEDVDFEENIKKMKNVSLELWNRNPDIDLYLGNYSPCCISIEGGAGWNATESAIADYMTDISVQVLNLVDKERKIPIMSAWLYVGEDQNNKTALVIDNIESDASQTDLYQKEIWKRIEEYIIAYAKEIGVDKIVMGASNNDIEPTKVNRDNNEYKKIGPISVNGRSTGYYLESEYVSNDYEEYVDEGDEEEEEYADEWDEEDEGDEGGSPKFLYLIWKR